MIELILLDNFIALRMIYEFRIAILLVRQEVHYLMHFCVLDFQVLICLFNFLRAYKKSLSLWLTLKNNISDLEMEVA